MPMLETDSRKPCGDGGSLVSNGIPLGAKSGTNYGLAPIVLRDFCSLRYLTLEEKMVVGVANCWIQMLQQASTG